MSDHITSDLPPASEEDSGDVSEGGADFLSDLDFSVSEPGDRNVPGTVAAPGAPPATGPDGAQPSGGAVQLCFFDATSKHQFRFDFKQRKPCNLDRYVCRPTYHYDPIHLQSFNKTACAIQLYNKQKQFYTMFSNTVKCGSC